MKKIATLILLFITIGFRPAFLQNKVDVGSIMTQAKEACLNVNSIEYEISQKGALGKFGYGQPKIFAQIVQQADILIANVGFGRVT